VRRNEGLAALEARLGHIFSDRELLARALTHASAVGEGKGPPATYERLEFLGDRVLGLAIADALIRRYPDAPEGELSRRLARLVSRETCSQVAREMGLDEHIRVGDSTLKASPRAAAGLVADACEAVIGAVFRDGGLEAAQRVIERFWLDRLASMNGPLRDAKTELQEWAHRRAYATPVYEEVSRSGPDHAPEFEVEVVIDGTIGARGHGRSKREAEHEAAEAVLRREGVWR